MAERLPSRSEDQLPKLHRCYHSYHVLAGDLMMIPLSQAGYGQNLLREALECTTSLLAGGM